MGDHELPPMETVRYTIVMPLIPGFKGSVAKMCKDPANSINGFIRWQSMDTIYATRLDCLCQGRKESLVGLDLRLTQIANKICESRTGEAGLKHPIMEVLPGQLNDSLIYEDFFLGCTPNKVIDLWRKERYNFSREHALTTLGLGLVNDSSSPNDKHSKISESFDNQEGGGGGQSNPPSRRGSSLSAADSQHLLINPREVFTSPHVPLSKATFTQRRSYTRALWILEDRHHRSKAASVDNPSRVSASATNNSNGLQQSQSLSSRFNVPNQSFSGQLQLRLLWKPDESATACYVCKTDFGWLNWRHHCRACGELVCDTCSAFKGQGRPMLQMPVSVLEQIKKQIPQRICSRCHEHESQMESTAGNMTTAGTISRRNTSHSHITREASIPFSKQSPLTH